MDNSTTFDFQLSQFGSWYLLAGIEAYAEAAQEVCQCETLLKELDRLEAWEQAHGGYYSYEYAQARFADLRASLIEWRDFIDAEDERYFAERAAQEARAQFTVVEGGLSGNNSQSG